MLPLSKFVIAAVFAALLPLSARSAQVSWGAAESNGIGLANGTDLPVGDLARIGTFNVPDSEIKANTANVSYLEAHFIEFARASIGDGVAHPAHWQANSSKSSNQLGVAGARIYYWVYDTSNGSSPTQIGIYTAPGNSAWIFPSDSQIPNTTTTDLSNVPHDSSGVLVGNFGTGTSDLSGDPLYNLAVVSAGSTPTPTPTPQATPTPTVTPSPSPTATSSGTPSPGTTPSPTPTPSATVSRALANVSTRGRVGTADDVLIGGFIIGGAGSKTVLLRALGPSLSDHGVTDALNNPVLTLYDSAGHQIAVNDDWTTSSDQQKIIDTGQAPTVDREAAMIVPLVAGTYTAIVSGSGGSSGVGLVEVFDLDANAASHVVNISTRGRVERDPGILIGGFIIDGTQSVPLIIRAIGPSLANAGVSAPLADPVLELRDAQGVLIVSNNNWMDTQSQEISSKQLAPSDLRESAILATLQPGAYTALVSGSGGGVGVGLIEVFDLTAR